jgi:hypothetical protein
MELIKDIYCSLKLIPYTINKLRSINLLSSAVLRIRIHRIHMFLSLLDPDPLVRCMDPDPVPDPSIIKHK